MIARDGRVAVVGATGLVGRELLAVLAEREIDDVRSLGREQSGRELAHALGGRDVTFLCTPAEVSHRIAPIGTAAGSLVIDCSSAFRGDPSVPLVVPEVNPTAALAHRGVIASPNCSTILLLLAVAPLHRAFGCRRVEVTTYQAVSGAGRDGMRELERTSRTETGRAPVPPPRLDCGTNGGTAVFPEPIAFNVLCHESEVDPVTGANGEERKIQREAHRILGGGTEAPRITATCARVPVFRSHCMSVTLTLARPAAEAEVREALSRAPSTHLVDDRASGRFPSALSAHGDGVLVGRIRRDRSQRRGRGFHLWLAGDQLRKGAALNAVQIADLVSGAEVAA